MAAQAQKEAVVFILDSYPSMNHPHPKIKREGSSSDYYNTTNKNTTSEEPEQEPTRLQCAKHAIESMLSDMILNSRKDSKVLIIVTKTKKTRHHLVPLDDDDAPVPFPNLTELPKHKNAHGFMKAPNADLIRQLWRVKPVSLSNQEACARATHLQGDICDAIILAADALHREAYRNARSKSTPYRYRRKIVLLTDASHPVVLDVYQTAIIVDGLRQMECPLHVLGLGFGLPSVEYKSPLDANAAVKIKKEEGEGGDSSGGENHPAQPTGKKVKREPGLDDVNDDDDNMSDNDNHDSPGIKVEEEEEDDDDEPRPDAVSSNNNNDNLLVYDTQEDREKLLGSLAEKTGGSVISVACMQELLDSRVGKIIKKSTGQNIQLHVGPGLTVWVKKVKILDPMKNPKMIEHVAIVDDRGNIRLNGLGQEMTEPVETTTTFWRRNKKKSQEKSGTGGDGDNEEEPTNGNDDDDDEAELIQIFEDDYADAVRYGKDLIPLGQEDKDGLKFEEDCGYEDDTLDMEKPFIHILGYVRRDDIPYRYLTEGPLVISGGYSCRACTLVAGLAQTLHKMGT